MQRLALFDLDNTLIDRQGGLADWARDFSATRALPSHAERLIGDALRERAYPADFERLRDTFGLADPVASLWSEYVGGMASRARCRAGLHYDLRRMRAAGWTLGIVTNGAADIQRAKLEVVGLSPLVDAVCVSEEVGVRKPSLAIFQAAADLCGAALADGGWMVGDNVEIDIAGGRSAGLRTAWVADGRQWPAHVRSPDLRECLINGGSADQGETPSERDDDRARVRRGVGR
ncbi:HAD family hydrolase, partial [Streptomyces sp. NPDC004647]|uniref:HAD family hydrolase n=1 Tax=Streptomyces sp. NPDC004647 TaxID=3154671 RepID=UPI0033A22864